MHQMDCKNAACEKQVAPNLTLSRVSTTSSTASLACAGSHGLRDSQGPSRPTPVTRRPPACTAD